MKSGDALEGKKVVEKVAQTELALDDDTAAVVHVVIVVVTGVGASVWVTVTVDTLLLPVMNEVVRVKVGEDWHTVAMVGWLRAGEV